MRRTIAQPSRLTYLSSLCLLLICMTTQRAVADAAIGYRVGTMGFGLDYNQRLSDTLTLRLGYNLYYMGKSQDSSGLHYDASLSITAASVLVDWHAWHTPFRFTLGITQPGPQLRANANATGDVTLNGQTYTADQFGSIHADIKSRYSVTPYVGIGHGFAVGEADRFTLQLDAGAIYTGALKGHVEANCADSLDPTVCQQLQTDIEAEVAQREYEARHLRWWPVLSVGFSMRW